MAKKAKKRRYSKGAAKKVGRAMKKRKSGTLKSGRSGKEQETSDRDRAVRGLKEGGQGAEEAFEEKLEGDTTTGSGVPS